MQKEYKHRAPTWAEQMDNESPQTPLLLYASVEEGENISRKTELKNEATHPHVSNAASTCLP